MTKSNIKPEAPRQAISNLLAKGFYKPSSVDRVCTYDQLTQAIESCRNARNEDGLWEIAMREMSRLSGLLTINRTESVLMSSNWKTVEIRPDILDRFAFFEGTGISCPGSRLLHQVSSVQTGGLT